MAIDERLPDAVEKAQVYLELFNSVTELQKKIEITGSIGNFH